MNALLFWMILMLAFLVAYALGVQRAKARWRATREPALEGVPSVGPETLAALQSRLAPMLAITGFKALGNVVQFTGHLRGKSDEVFRRIREAFAGEPVTPLLLEGEENDVRVVIMPGRQAESEPKPANWALHWLLFAATLGTTTWAGALHAGVNLLQHPERFTVGLPYSLGLLLILGSHELGHYFATKFHGIQVTPPYFIPVPFALGTFGAFIKIKSITPDRRALFDVAVAGPLAGLVFAIPALLIGLRYSELVPGHGSIGLGQVGVDIGSSVVLARLANLSRGAAVLQGGRL